MYPVGALVPGGASGGNCVAMFTLTQNKWKIDAVLGVWPLHGLGSAWGGIAAGVFGGTALGGLGGTSFLAQLLGTCGLGRAGGPGGLCRTQGDDGSALDACRRLLWH